MLLTDNISCQVKRVLFLFYLFFNYQYIHKKERYIFFGSLFNFDHLTERDFLFVLLGVLNCLIVGRSLFWLFSPSQTTALARCVYTEPERQEHYDLVFSYFDPPSPGPSFTASSIFLFASYPQIKTSLIGYKFPVICLLAFLFSTAHQPILGSIRS